MSAKPAGFARVTTWLARGAQPRKKHFEALRFDGIDTIVNLRRRDEAEVIESCAPHVLAVHIPVADNEPPTTMQAVKWLRFCDDVYETRHIYVHCKNGNGRTSVFCALVRIAQGWDIESAIDEQRAFGFRKRKHRRQIKFLREFHTAVQRGEVGIPHL
jgi:protein tyrosine/serine phosphatase